jgi:tRNA A-37 threonylcarbamoyl transferase component Bud32/class 3 adenylate cyclase
MSENEQTDNPASVTDVTTPVPPSPDIAAARPQDGLTVGDVLNNRYTVERELGRGGIGAVYLARDRQLLSKPVVVKVLLDKALQNEWVVQKFKHEMEALTRIEHPGVIGILDAGETPVGLPFIVMQYVEGDNMRAALKPGEGMELARVADIMRQVGEALNAAHDAGVLHRDLKPENVMLRRAADGRDHVKLIDFGIAKVKDSVIAPSTATPKTIGTVAYMAPEQLEVRPVTAASDVYALGVITYEMVTGRRPFTPESLFQLLEMQREGVRVRPRDLRRALPEAAEAVILKALAYAPKERYQCAREFGEALWRAMAEGGEDGYVDEPDFSRAAAKTLRAPAAGVATAGDRPQDVTRSAMEMGNVLFMDIVRYSKLPTDEQTKVLRRLQQTVRETKEFARAQAEGRLIRLPTGDGMALVFFGAPEAPVRCALEVGSALRESPQIELRMGVHSGPVEKITDVNDKENVAGDGINMAQRVMDCGDAGHILLSKRVADDLGQYSRWRPYLHDLGEAEVKHGVRVHVVNLYGDGWGNPQPPKKFRSKREDHAKRKLPVPILLGAAVAVLVLAAVAGVLFLRPQPTGPVTKSNDAGPNPAAAAPERTLNYWVEVQKYRNGKPDKEPFRLAREMVFQADDHVWFNFSSPQPGHLYIINEGPEPENSLPQYNVLFPTPTANNSSSALAASQALRVPGARGFVIDDERGTEKVWVVWSAQPVAELEAISREVVTPEQLGVVSKPDQIKLLQSFIADHTKSSPQELKDEGRKLTTVSGTGDVIVSLRKLEHY